MVSAAIRQAFIQPDHAGAVQTWRHVADQLRARWPKLETYMDDAETDVLAYIVFPAQHRTKLHSTNPLERLNKEVKRRADVNDGWQLQHRYMQVEAMADLNPPAIEEEKPLQITPKAA